MGSGAARCGRLTVTQKIQESSNLFGPANNVKLEVGDKGRTSNLSAGPGSSKICKVAVTSGLRPQADGIRGSYGNAPD